MCTTITKENALQQNSFDVIAHQLTRIADAMQPAGMQVTEEDALAAYLHDSEGARRHRPHGVHPYPSVSEAGA